MARLPQHRVKTIMKTADGAEIISKDAIVLTTRATEMFIRTLVKEGYDDTRKGKKLNYTNLVNVIHNSSRYEFLEIVVPKKITVREYKDLMARKERQEHGLPSEHSSSESDSGSNSDNGSEKSK